MLSCTPGERAFVIALVMTGGADQGKAAYDAGFGNSIEVASVQAARMVRRPRVISAIREEADKAMQGDALLGRAVLREIAADTRHKDRFKAGVELLNRAGLLVETTRRLIVQDDSRTEEQIKQDIETIFKKLYKDQPLPVSLQPPIDAEFSEVVKSSDGIEDLIGE